MAFQYLNKIIFQKNASLKDVLKRFSETNDYSENSGFAIITDEAGKCIGVMTDGDIRRKLVENISIESLTKLLGMG